MCIRDRSRADAQAVHRREPDLARLPGTNGKWTKARRPQTIEEGSAARLPAGRISCRTGVQDPHAGSGPVRVGDRGLGHFDVLVAACLQELFGAEPAQLGVWARTDDDLTEGLLGEADADVGHDPEVPARSEEQVRSSVDGHPPLVLFREGGVLDAGQPRQNLTLCVRVSTGAGVSRGWQAFHLCDEWGDGLGAVEDSLESSSDLLCRRGQRCGVESEREAPAPAIAAPLTEEVMVVAETSNEHLGVAAIGVAVDSRGDPAETLCPPPPGPVRSLFPPFGAEFLRAASQARADLARGVDQFLTVVKELDVGGPHGLC